jgi:peptide chain release factor subunit 3
MGTVITGKIESGRVCVSDQCFIMPDLTHVEVTNIYCEDIEMNFGVCGDDVRLKLKNVGEVSFLLFLIITF